MKLFFCILIVFLNLTLAAESKDQRTLWQEFKSDFDNLAGADAGFLSIQDMQQVEPGESVFLPLEMANRKADLISIRWSSKNPGPGSMSVKYTGKEAWISGPDIETTDLLKAEGKKVSLPCGLIVRVSFLHETILKVWLHNPNLPSHLNFKGLDFFPYSDKGVIEGTFEKNEKPTRKKYLDSRDEKGILYIVGLVKFKIADKNYNFPAYSYQSNWDKIEAQMIFIKDLTSGDTTYEGGRVVEIKAPMDNTNSAIEINFNSAYAFLCVHSKYYNCPIGLTEKIDSKLEFGERTHKSQNADLADWKTLLQSLVDINSGTDNTEGLKKNRDLLIPLFTKLGFQVRDLELAKNRHLLVFDFPDSSPKIAFAGHSDTVFQKTSTFQKFENKLEILSGPGVADMKGGLVMMLQSLVEINDPKLLRQIRILINDDEETGSQESMAKMQELIQDIPTVLIFEPVGIDQVAVAHSGVTWLKLKTTGLAAHAGDAPLDGINACVELGLKIADLVKLNNYKRGLTVNVGILQGGTKANVVCDSAELSLDLRFKTPADKDKALYAIKKIASRVYYINPKLKRGAQTELSVVVDIPSTPLAASADLFNNYKQVAKKLNTEISGVSSGGVPAYGLSLPGKKVLNGLGPAQEGMHSLAEKLFVQATERKMKINSAFILSLLKDK